MWTVGSVRVYVQGQDFVDGQTVVRLQPLEGGTITQTFGYEDVISKITGVIVGDDTRASLQAFAKTGNQYEILWNATSYGSYYIKKVSFSRVSTVYQTMDTVNHLCTDPVYAVEFELV